MTPYWSVDSGRKVIDGDVDIDRISNFSFEVLIRLDPWKHASSVPVEHG